ncbi:hypothetical protein QP028_16215 [Corynebacterium suedekumii]|nr:hypothetical protein QP028_16215 [Corynebacterium suedekumii]
MSLFNQFRNIDQEGLKLRYLDVNGQIIEGVQRDIDEVARKLTLTYPEGQTPDNPLHHGGRPRRHHCGGRGDPHRPELHRGQAGVPGGAGRCGCRPRGGRGEAGSTGHRHGRGDRARCAGARRRRGGGCGADAEATSISGSVQALGLDLATARRG